MNDNWQSNSVLYLQKKIIELTRQYYNAMRDNISFEKLKTIFLKRKKLENELSELERKYNDNSDLYNTKNIEDSSLNINERISS